MPEVYEIILRLTLSFILGGIIGIEREGVNRPAGFRTHILVCIGATLITLTGIFLSTQHNSYGIVDPSRLSAQIISGIGFLGAGTIIKEGPSVKGLTTAAGLWAVAGVGIAVGSGFYLGAIASAVLILITLIIFSKLEGFIKHGNNGMVLKIKTLDRPGLIGEIGTILGNLCVSITGISLDQTSDTDIVIELRINVPRKLSKANIISSLADLENVISVKSHNI